MRTAADPFAITDAGALGLLAKLVQEHRVVHLHADVDADNKSQLFNAVAITHDERRVTAVHPTLLGLLRCLDAGGDLNKEPRRTCPKCRKGRRAAEFSKDAAGPAGLRRICRSCEARRVARYAAQKAGKKQTAAVPGGKAPPRARRQCYFGRRSASQAASS